MVTTDMKKMMSIQALIMTEFQCEGGEAQNLARQIMEITPQATVPQITGFLTNYFNVAGGAVLGIGNGVATDIYNVLLA
jgi:hypothetical protein